MHLRPLKSEEKPRLMIIPMIDIIFFLLVFFMMSMLTMVTQKTIALNLPKTTAAKVDTTKTVPISVTARGQIYIDDKPTSLEALAEELAQRKSGKENVTVVLRGDRAAEYGAVVEVMDAVRLAGIERVSIATEGSK